MGRDLVAGSNGFCLRRQRRSVAGGGGRRLRSVPCPDVENPFPWLAEMMDIKIEQNFFEGRVTEYQKASSLETVDDDEL